MVTFVVDLYHDGLFACNPVRYLAGEHRVIKDINFEGMNYDNFFRVMRRLVLDKPLSFFYVIPGVPMNIGLRPICNNEQLNDFVQALFENDCHLDMYTKHQRYDVLEMINDDRHCEDKSDSDLKMLKRLSIDDPWLNKLVGKGRFVGEMEDPIPGLKGRFFVEQNDLDENFVEPKYKYQQAGASVDEIPKYREDPVMPSFSSCNKREEPSVKRKSCQLNEASGSKSNLTPEHAKMMDKEAFADMVKRDAENKAKDEEIWKKAYEEDKYWEEYAAEFKDWEYR
ncbi:hypothetical protein Tco_1412454 [Tanacetum coccineum]